MADDGERFRAILENRSEILRFLVDSPATKPEIVSTLRTSRSTVDRAIRDLIEISCITERGNEYQGTTTGRIALEEYDHYQETTQSIRSSHEFLNHLATDATLDTPLLRDASITLAEQHAPDQALAPSIELFQEATVLKGLAPVVLSFYPTLIEDQIQHGNLSVEIIAAEMVIATLPNLMNPQVDALLESESLSLYESRTPLPYALWLMETPDGSYAGITAYDSGGVAGVLINDTKSAVQWAHTQYATYRDHAQPVSSNIDSQT